MAVILLFVIPIGVLASTPIIAAVFSYFLTKDGEARNPDRELIALNR